MRTIIGFGSLLSENSARKTCPELQNFRKITVPDYKRIFNMVSYVTLGQPTTNRELLEFSSCNVIPSKKSNMLATAFDIQDKHWEELEQREFDYQHIEIPFIENSAETSCGTACVGYKNDEELFKCERIQNIWKDLRVELQYTGKIMRDDLLPGRIYLKFCIESAQAISDEYLNNFLDESFLGDNQTTIRKYIQQNPDILNTNQNHNIKNYK